MDEGRRDGKRGQEKREKTRNAAFVFLALRASSCGRGDSEEGMGDG